VNIGRKYIQLTQSSTEGLTKALLTGALGRIGKTTSWARESKKRPCLETEMKFYFGRSTSATEYTNTNPTVDTIKYPQSR